MAEESIGSEPAFGTWTEAQLRSLVEVSVATYEGQRALSGSNSAVMAMANRIAIQTGGSYPWLCREIEKIVGGPRG